MDIYWTSLLSPNLANEEKEFNLSQLLYIYWIAIKEIFKYQTLSKIEASLSSFHAIKFLSINSVSSKNMSSRILLLYFGVDSIAVPTEYLQLEMNIF